MNQRPLRIGLPWRTVLTAFAITLVLTGCDDPSEVGIGLVEQQSGEPTFEAIEASSISASTEKDVTGGDPFGGAIYALSGTVEDPVFGTLTAEAYVDFLPADDPGSDFREGNVNFGELTLSIDYVYGDTTALASFELYDMVDEWEANGRHADTTLTVGSLVTSFTADPSTDVVRIELPASWLSGQSSVLRAEDFAEEFNGFAIRPVDGNTIVGFETPNSELVAATAAGDTARYQLTKRLSSTTRSGTQNFTDSVLIQDGFESVASVRFPLGSGGLENAAVHRTGIRVTTSDQFGAVPSGFARPAISRIGLRAVSAEGDVELTLSTIDFTGDEIVFDNDVIAEVFQSAALGRSSLDRFEIFVPAASAGVGFLLLRNPVAEVTFTPID